MDCDLHLDDAFSENTKAGYASDWKVWSRWCAKSGNALLPATGESLAAFIEEAGATRCPATLSRYIAAIAAAHRMADLPDPTKIRVVKVAMKRLLRQKGKRQRQALGITAEMRDRMLAATGPGNLGLRNRALLSVAYDIGRRRSEIVALLAEDIDRAEDGTATILVRRAKCDQDGNGQVCYLSVETVKAVDAWLDASGVEEGPIIRSLRRGGHPAPEALPAPEVSRLYKELAAAAGYPPEIWRKVSGHSTRVGMAQDMAAAGIDLAAIMTAGGWKSPSMAAHYCERVDARRGGAARLAILQGRSPTSPTA